MNFKEIASRLTGISCPVFGVSWTPPEAETTVARRVVTALEDRIIMFGAQQGHYASWKFNGALGALRGVFGVHIAKLATAYGLDVEDDLASILPEGDDVD